MRHIQFVMDAEEPELALSWVAAGTRERKDKEYGFSGGPIA